MNLSILPRITGFVSRPIEPRRPGILIGLLLLAFLASGGCASTTAEDNDPFESYNRAMTRFNLKADEMVLQPVARGYQKVVPSPARNGFRNFYRNLLEPLTMVYDLLQGKWTMAGRDAGRFLINSTLGFAGLNDVASHLGLERRDEDFGQVMAVWGVPPGPHFVLPLLGPGNIRDGVGRIPGFYYATYLPPDHNPEEWIAAVTGVIDLRSQFLGTEEMLELQPDKYLFLRESFRQRRHLAIYEDQIDADARETDEALLDELLGE